MVREDITTVKLQKKTKERIEKLRMYKRESYDEILQRMLGILNICHHSPEKAQARLKAIERQVRRKIFVEKRTQRREKITEK